MKSKFTVILFVTFFVVISSPSLLLAEDYTSKNFPTLDIIAKNLRNIPVGGINPTNIHIVRIVGKYQVSKDEFTVYVVAAFTDQGKEKATLSNFKLVHLDTDLWIYHDPVGNYGVLQK